MCKYLVRLDDACPYMDKGKWEKIEEILERYDIKPMVGIIPHNEDSMTIVESECSDFWGRAIGWQSKGWTIALHGYNHCYVTTDGGINPIHKRSEFAGLPYEQQRNKILEGYKILKEKGLSPTYFFAPSHTYDENTIKALMDVTPIRLLSDTMGRYPYKYDEDFTIVPCQMGRFREIPLSGYWTFCFHPNIMDENAMNEFESFIVSHQSMFVSFDDLPINGVGGRSLMDRLMEWAYLTLRKLKR